MKDTTVVIRSVKERTENICYQLVKAEFAENAIFFSRKVPFAATLKDALEIGLRENRKWTLHVDADVLPDKGKLAELVQLAESLPENILEIQGLVLDKFLPIRRPAGNHLYRTKYIEKILNANTIHSNAQRPESSLLRMMSGLGFPAYQSDILIGLHDYEQYYEDIFRKCFLQVQKTDWALPYLETYWTENAPNDPDFKVALLALYISKISKGAADTNKARNKAEINALLQLVGIEEKRSSLNWMPTSYCKTAYRKPTKMYLSRNCSNV
ncbi:MAG: hypothetical protein HC831_25430 [Chloroflexia bacterium]|nr:hypothetical protein [Chloroflexia bacterium]